MSDTLRFTLHLLWTLAWNAAAIAVYVWALSALMPWWAGLLVVIGAACWLRLYLLDARG